MVEDFLTKKLMFKIPWEHNIFSLQLEPFFLNNFIFVIML